MAYRDLYNNLTRVELLKSAAINDTDTKTSLLDTRGFDSALIEVNTGVFTGADADSYVKMFLQESDTTTDGDFTSVAVADMQRSTTGLDDATTAGLFAMVDSTSEDEVRFSVGYKGSKRYIRVLLDFTTGTGGVTAANVAVTGILGHPHNSPAPTVAAVAAT